MSGEIGDKKFFEKSHLVVQFEFAPKGMETQPSKLHLIRLADSNEQQC